MRFALYIVGGVILFTGVAIYLEYSIRLKQASCASIQAELIQGRSFSVCAKSDGSLWRIPK